MNAPLPVAGGTLTLIRLGIRENLKNGYDVTVMSVISWMRNLFVNQKDREYECWAKCLKNLSPREEIVLMLEQFRDDKATKIRHRRELAAKLGITYNELRLEVQRIKAKSQDCVRKCMSEAAEPHTRRKNGT